MFAISTEKVHDATKSIPLALQRLFYNMIKGNGHSTSSSACSTRELTKSFGWTAQDAFVQHDVQELSRLLCHALESQLEVFVELGDANRSLGN